MRNRSAYQASLIGAVLLPAALSGCGPRTIPPVAGVLPPGEPVEVDWSDYALLLDRVVAGETIDTEKLLANRPLLDRILARLARVGPTSKPESFPQNADRLAFLINAHNAAVLRSLVALATKGKIPVRLPWSLEQRFQFVIDGVLRTPAGLRRLALDQAGTDWRVRLALYDGHRIGPPLARRVFFGDMLDAQLNHQTRRAIGSDRLVRIDHEASKRLLVWRGLYEIRAELIADYERRMQTTDATMLSVLLEWCEPQRRETLNSAIGYRAAPLPADHRTDGSGDER